jgi:SPX domain protein involved in polyphosphate accumulation
VSNIEFRVENKYLVSNLELAVIAKRLSAVMQQDIHQTGDCYEIRSIYFDDAWDRCMDENDAGIDCRQKYRIRTYGSENAPINLEIKAKQNGLTKKTACTLSHSQYERILDGGNDLEFGDKKPLNQLLLQMRCAKMQPKIIIAYERTAFVHPIGNVRITFDRNIMASRNCASFLEPRIEELVPILPVGMHVLEVKYDEYLPDVIARQLQTGKLQQTAFSKYYLGRLAVNGEFPITL